MFVLFNIIIAFLFGVIDGVVGTFNPETGFGLLGTIYLFAVLLPSIAVAVRRLHDTGRTGWWMLLVFVPLIGGIVILVFMVLSGDEGDNEYGSDPMDQPLPE